MTTYVDRIGKPITRAEWFNLCGDGDYRRVGSTTVGNLWVSTVWLGLAHGSQYFETMVFGSDTDHPHDCYTERYPTWIEAFDGHAKVVAALTGRQQPTERRFWKRSKG